MNKNWPFEQGLLSNANDKLCNTMKSNLFLVIVGDALGFVFVCLCMHAFGWLACVFMFILNKKL